MAKETGTVKSTYCSFTQAMTCVWHIPNYRNMMDPIVSPTFGPSPIDPEYRESWHLAVHPNGSRRAEDGYVSLYLYCDTPELTPTVKITMKMVRLYESMASSYRQSHPSKTFSDVTGGFGFHHFITKHYLLDRDSCFLNKDDSLAITVIIKHLKNRVDKSEIDLSALCILSHDMMAAFQEDKEFGDVTFNMRGRLLRANKGVLSARSPVFRAMFNSDMEEANNKMVHIDDIEYEVMDALFRYIYSGTVYEEVEENSLFVIKLFSAADKYQLDYLKSLCEAFISSNLFLENVVPAMIAGHLHNSKAIKHASFSLVSTADVKQVKDWAEVHAVPGLLDDMLSFWHQKGLLNSTQTD